MLEVNFGSSISTLEVLLLLNPLLIHLKKKRRREHHRSWQLLNQYVVSVDTVLHIVAPLWLLHVHVSLPQSVNHTFTCHPPSHPIPYQPIWDSTDKWFWNGVWKFFRGGFSPEWYQAKRFVELIKTRRMPYSLFIFVYLFCFSNHYTCRYMQ